MMKKISIGSHHKCSLIVLSFCLLIVGCQSLNMPDVSSPDKTVAQVAKKNYKSDCSGKVFNLSTTEPEALYQAMILCVKDGKNYDEAVFFYSLAGTYTWFDAQRINSQYARSMHARLLAESMVKISSAERDVFWKKIQNTLGDAEKKQLLCKKVADAGMPVYHADYMMIDKSGEHAEPEGNQQAWRSAVKNYLDCG